MKKFVFMMKVLLTMVLLTVVAGPVFADGTVTTTGGATWTYGTTQGTSVWYWDGGSDQSSRSMANRSSDMCDAANYDGHGWEAITPTETNRICQAQAAAAKNRYRVVMQKISYAISVPAYASVNCAYTLDGYCDERTTTQQYKGIELFDWGTTDHTLTQTINTVNSDDAKSGNNDDGNNYLIASVRAVQDNIFSSSHVPATFSISHSFSLSNASGASAKTCTEYLTMAAFGRAGTTKRGLDAYVSYSNEKITYSYYNQLQYNLNGGSGSIASSSFATSNTVTSVTPTNGVYTLKGWNTKADGTGTSYKAGQTITASSTSKGPIVLYAQWVCYSQARAYVPSEGAAGVYVTVNDHLKTTYESIDSKNQWVTSGEDHTGSAKGLSTTTGHVYYFYAKPQPGYTHIGWSTTEGGAVIPGSEPDADKCWVLNAIVTQSGTTSSAPQWFEYYPVFRPNYNVSFNANGGTGSMATQTVGLTADYTLPSNTFTAPTYTVSFHGNGGGTTAAVNKTLSFNGWEDRGSIVFGSTTYAYTDFDAPYYANTYSDLKAAFGYNKYELIEHYVNYGSGEGRSAKGTTAGVYPDQATVSQLTTTAGYTVPLYAQWTGTITLPDAPTAPEGAYFLGWYDGYDKVGNAGDTYSVTKTVQLTAQWGDTYTMTIYNNGLGTIDGQTAKVLTMKYGSTNNNTITPSEWVYGDKYHYGKVIAPIGDTYYDLFDAEGKAVKGSQFFDAEGKWTYTANLDATTIWAGNVTTITLDAAPGGFKGVSGSMGQIELIQESAQHFSDGVLNPYYPGYVFTGGYTGQNGTGYRVYRDGSRATTDGDYWKDSGEKTTSEPIIPVLTWDRGDLSSLTLYAHWVEAYFYFEVADGAWETQGCWMEYDAGNGQTGLLASHQNADTLPQSFNNVIVSHTLRINTEVYCKSLTILSGGTVIISPTGGLTVGEGGLTGVTKDNFIIESTTTNQGYFRMSPSATTPMPTATVQFATRSTLDTGANRDATWQYFGVPCTTNFTCDNATWLNQWSTASGWVCKAQGQNHMLSPWLGYCVTQYGQPIYSFVGQLQGGNQTIALSGEAATQGMNLIANSYSAPIDVRNFEDADFSDATITKTLYVYNAGSWNEWNNNKATTPTAIEHTPGTFTAIPVHAASYLESAQTLIAPMQAIMVQLTDAGSPTITFNYERLVWNAAANAGSTLTDPIRSPERINHQSSITNRQSPLAERVKMIVTSEQSGADHLYLLGKEDWTAGYDNGYDAPKMATRGLVNLYTTIAEGMLAVDARADIDSTYVGFAAGQDSEYTLEATAIIGEDLYLLDTQTGIRTQLVDSAIYTFSAAPNSIDDHRFLIVREQPAPNMPTAFCEVEPTDRTTYYYTPAGQLVGSDIQNLPVGIYLRRCGNQCTKIVIR